MSKREKIIVIITLMAAIYAGYHFFFEKMINKDIVENDNGSATLNRFIEDALAIMEKESLTEREKYIIASALGDWGGNPFAGAKVIAGLKGDSPSQTVEKGFGVRKQTPQMSLKYSGYLTMEGKTFCIINGIEYEKGETLESGEYLVCDISPHRVVLGIDCKKNDIILHFIEME